MTMMHLLDLIDDILLIVIYHLEVPDILSFRRTCRRFQTLTFLRAVWQNACKEHIVANNLPFPFSSASSSLRRLDAAELEQRTRHALRLRSNWKSASPEPMTVLKFSTNSSNIVSDVRFVLRRGHEWLLTVSKGIWSVISCWDMKDNNRKRPRKVGEWSRKGALIKSVAVNPDPESDVCLTVAFTHGSAHRIEIYAITPRHPETSPETAWSQVIFTTLFSMDTSERPVSLASNVIILSDDFVTTRLLEWTTGRTATLRGSDESSDDAQIPAYLQHDRCLSVLFAHKSILVARARSLDLFPLAELEFPGADRRVHYPLASYSFGWIDSVAMAFAPGESMDRPGPYPPICILLRAESDDPWSSNIHRLCGYLLRPNPDYDPKASPHTVSPSSPPTSEAAPRTTPPSSPYLFPPEPTTAIPSLRGFLRCADVALGPRGTALWVQPRPRTARSGLTVLDPALAEQFQLPAVLGNENIGMGTAHVLPGPAPVPDPSRVQLLMEKFAEESLCAAVFPGPLQRDRDAQVPSLPSATMQADGDGGREGDSQTMTRKQVRVRRLWVNVSAAWTAMDYDEGTGRIALGASDGGVVVLFM